MTKVAKNPHKLSYGELKGKDDMTRTKNQEYEAIIAPHIISIVLR